MSLPLSKAVPHTTGYPWWRISIGGLWMGTIGDLACRLAIRVPYATEKSAIRTVAFHEPIVSGDWGESQVTRHLFRAVEASGFEQLESKRHRRDDANPRNAQQHIDSQSVLALATEHPQLCFHPHMFIRSELELADVALEAEFGRCQSSTRSYSSVRVGTTIERISPIAASLPSLMQSKQSVFEPVETLQGALLGAATITYFPASSNGRDSPRPADPASKHAPALLIFSSNMALHNALKYAGALRVKTRASVKSGATG